MKKKLTVLLTAILVVMMSCAVACSPSASTKVKMTFESNGGTAVQAIEQDAGTDVTAPTAPEKNGYTFLYWCKDEALSQEYTFDKMPESDITLYAKWQANTYTVAFELNDGDWKDGVTPPSSYTTGSTVELPVTAERDGFDFGGWYDNATFGGSAITAISATDYGNKTFYAKWNFATYGITYVLNGLDQNPDNPESYTFGTTTALYPLANKGDKGFMGWYDNELCEGTALTEISDTTMGAVTLYAKVQSSVYSIEYNAAGGKHENPTYYISGDGLTLKDATREFYDFLGWFDAQDTKVTQIPAGATGPKTLTAKWAAHAYTIEYDLGGGVWDGVTPAVSYTVEDDRTELAYPFRTGYAFVGWFDSETGGGEVTHFGGSDKIADIKVWARYKQQSGVEIQPDGTVTRFTNAGDETKTLDIVIPDNAVKINDHILYGNQTGAADKNNDYMPETLFIGKASRLEYIGNFSFYYTSNETDANWNPTGNFESCTVNLPSSLTYIGNYAFTDLPFDFVLPENNNVEFIGGAALDGTTWRKNIPATQEEIYFGKVFLKYAGGNKTVTVKDGTIGIAGNAFLKNAGIEEIVLPSSLRAIGDGAFEGCTAISEIDIPVSVTKVFYNLFKDWTADQVVNLPFKQGEVPSGWDQNWNSATNAVLAYTWCNITYNVDNGILTGAANQYETGKEYVLPEPTKSGFDFLGWYTTADFQGDPIVKITADTRGEVTVYAKWSGFTGGEEDEYTITLVTEDGVFDADSGVTDNKLVYNYNDETKKLPIPLKAGYAFIKWIDESRNEVTEYGGQMTGNRTFTAVYEQAQGYTTSSDGNEITGWVDTKSAGNRIVIADNITSMRDHIGNATVTDWETEFFIGQYSRLEYIGDNALAYMPFVQVDVDIPDTIKYIGTNAMVNCNFRLRFGDAPNLTAIGAGALLGTAFRNITVKPYLKQEGNNDYYIGKVYYLNGGKEAVVDIKAGTVAIAGDAFKEDPSDELTRGTLTTVNIPDSVKRISENAFGNSSVHSVGINEIRIPASVEITGYGLFGSWTADQTVILPFAEGAKPAGWHDNWAENSNATFLYTAYPIEYHTNGGTLPAGAKTQYNRGEAYTLPNPTKVGFDFGGWFTTETFDAGTQINEISATATGKVIVYAKWTSTGGSEQYTITLNPDGGEFGDAVTITYNSSDARTELGYPLKSGYAFVGWFTADDDEITYYGGGLSGNYELTAKYEKGQGYNFNEATKDISSWVAPADGSNKIVIADDIVKINNWAINGIDEAWKTAEKTLFVGKNSRLKFIGDSALNGVKFAAGTRLYVPSTVEYIGINALLNSGLYIDFAEDLPVLSYIGNYAFDGTKWKEEQFAELQGSVYVGKVYYYAKGDSGAEITIKDGTLGIAGGAFMYATHVTSVVIPSGVTTIADNAFGNHAGAYAANISEITVPASVVKTGYDIFGSWANTQTVNLPFAEGAKPEGWDANWAGGNSNANFVYAQA